MPVPIKGTGLVYFAVPKIACTSIKSAILKANDPRLFAEVEAVDNKIRNVHHVYPSKKFRWWRGRFHLPRGDWFCVVRDPIKRAVSGYRNRILFHRDLTKLEPGVLERHGLDPEPDLNRFARDIAEYVEVSDAVHHHFSPHRHFLGDRPDRFAHVFKLSEMGDLADLVASRGVTLDIPHEQTGGPKVSIDDLSAEGEAALRRFYAGDYRIWGDHFDR